MKFLWTKTKWKRLRSLKGVGTYLCRICSTEFWTWDNYGEVHCRCSGCGEIHKVDTGNAPLPYSNFATQQDLRFRGWSIGGSKSGQGLLMDGVIENASDVGVSDIRFTMTMKLVRPTKAFYSFRDVNPFANWAAQDGQPRMPRASRFRFFVEIPYSSGRIVDAKSDRFELTGKRSA